MKLPTIIVEAIVIITTALMAHASDDLRLLPYPQNVERLGGSLAVGPANYVTGSTQSSAVEIAKQSLNSYLPKTGKKTLIRLGSIEAGYDKSWLTAAQKTFLSKKETSEEAYVLTITSKGITIVGKGKIGMLYGVQTINQLLLDADRRPCRRVPCLSIRDWPDLKWRCLSPTMTWYSGYNRLEGYDLCNWTLDEWKWLVDWSLLHKCNGWALCMYGYWPFTLPGYESNTLDVDSFRYNPETGRKEPYHFTHRNIRKEFLPELIRYANERGVQVYAYIGKNSFNGSLWRTRPETNCGGAWELLPFASGVHEYWDAFIGRILDIGFNGFVFEDPEAYHVPNQNEQCWKTFWEPWAKTYGFKSVADTDENKPPIGVHLEYYTWLFREFDRIIQIHAERLGRKPEVYLISHILLNRIMSESATKEERAKWFALFDEKQGRKVPIIVAESREKDYADIFGGDRIASLGGRGGACTCAMRRIASVNNCWSGGPMGASVDYERDCQRHIIQAGGFGAMGYIFEWTNTEIFGYIAAQHLWRSSGVPGVNNEDQTGFLDYAYRLHYGDKAGALVARAMDEGSCINDAMLLEGVWGSQFPSTGAPLHRDYQLLAAMADRSLKLATSAYQLYTGKEPDLYHPSYNQDSYRWNGYNTVADKLFKTERLRLLCVSQKRSQYMCETVLAHRKAEKLDAQGAPAADVNKQLDLAIKWAKASQLLYQVNYDDDYDGTDGLCARITEKLEELRCQAKLTPLSQPLMIPWEKMSDIIPAGRKAQKPGLYLSVDLGLDEKKDYFRIGVVFTIQAQVDGGEWQTIFRRAVERRATGWEHWDIPIDKLLTSKPSSLNLRLLTDSYSRAQDRNAPTWEWALWGSPRVQSLAPDGKWNVISDLAETAGGASAYVRLDDGTERPFDGKGMDSTGATFKAVGLGPVDHLRRGEGKNWQWIGGFDGWISSAPHVGQYLSYLGFADSAWVYAGEDGSVSWLTSPAAGRKETAVVFIGGTDYAPGHAEVFCDGRKLLDFETGNTSDARWEKGGVELRYIHGGDTRDEKITYGLSGVFVLRLPASLAHPGKPFNLSVKMKPGGGWFMVHGYRNPLEANREADCPSPEMPAIAAVTPHHGAFGLTIGEYVISLPK